MFALTLLRRIKFMKVSDLSTGTARQNFPRQKKIKTNAKRSISETLLKTPVFKDIVIWHLNEQFLPYRTGDCVFPTISAMLLCNGWPKARKLFFRTKLNVYVNSYWGANKCRQHSQLMKELQYQD